MNKVIAKRVLSEAMSPWRDQAYEALAQKVDLEPERYEIEAEDGRQYQVEVEIMWDDKPGGTVRVLGSVDDGGFRAYFPMIECILVPKPPNKLSALQSF